MLRIILFMSIFVLTTSNLCIAGWGDILNSVDNVDKLITKKPITPTPPTSNEITIPSREERNDAPSVYDDEHFIQKDDFFIQKNGLENNAWMWVDLAKMVTAPRAETKHEGEFMKVVDGQSYWTKHYWKTRIASNAELKFGLHIIAFNDNQHDGIYKAPDKKDRARGGGWFYAKITDMSDMYRGYVTVSGNYKVGLKNIRVIEK